MKGTSKVLNYLRRNAAYLIIALCIFAIGLSITLVVVNKNKDSKATTVINIDSGTDKEVVVDIPTDPIAEVVFIMPVSTATEIAGYSEYPTFNATMKRYSAHLAVDFFAEEGSDVYAVYDGVVESVDSTLLTGTTVVINHGNGLKTIYNSLLDGDGIVVGSTVSKGDVIGQVSSTNRQEAVGGAHLHFQVEENGSYIDPYKYLEFSEK